MNSEESTAIRPARIDIRTRSLTDEHVLEFIEFYDNLKKSEKDLVVSVIQEVSEETKTYIQIDFYSKDDTQIDGVMCPYKE